MKEIIVNILLILCVISILGIFTGLIMWILIGAIGVKVFLTGIISAILSGSVASGIEEGWN